MEESRQYPVIKKGLSWLLLFVLPPVILGLLFMRPILTQPAKIALPKDDEKLELIPVDLRKTPLDDFSEVLVGTPLKLRWYKVCLDNKNEVSLNEVKIKLPYDKDREAGAMEARINFRGGKSHEIYAAVNQLSCNYVKLENSVADITIVYRRPLVESFDPTFKVVQSDEKSGTAVVHQSAYVHTDASAITLLNRWDEVIYKLLIFVIGWVVVVVNFRDSWRIFDRRNEKQ